MGLSGRSYGTWFLFRVVIQKLSGVGEKDVSSLEFYVSAQYQVSWGIS
jgi:hypothetical protein